jgi:hypothetical protein
LLKVSGFLGRYTVSIGKWLPTFIRILLLPAVAEDLSFLGCYDVVTGKYLPTFGGIVVPPSSEQSSYSFLTI